MATFSMNPEVNLHSLSSSDPLWFKDAVIYQLHVRAFYDSSGDGIGDFRGLTEKLDYIQDLGITAIWLLPFFLSPLRDDGYDIADYKQIHPAYGDLHDFQRFINEAHRRDIRIITEIVMNHTSDQHEWFQKSRRAKPGERWRDYYVWSDTDDRYQDARVIFQDFESSNWTWDPVAGAYYWHRFYKHQPDLNFDNPDVHAAMFDVIDFWLNMGVDGMRLDAVPYLYQREGTNCENLPETHSFLKMLRKHVDEKYKDVMLLAEANQWPEDAAAYFGDGDECHMNFHFPLMPRLFMAIEREDRFPIIDILDQTPKISENCQWGLFLRNHDELTLEMVTDEERDYMYRAYVEDPRARVNLGIRRRFAPLMHDIRSKMELMNTLLLSLPGTPIIYYGDEIRMGDNIYLGDRDGVRTPMQWNDDRNAGFSRVNPQQLYLPVIIDPLFHFASRNVEVEQSRPQSMLWWMRRIITLRKKHSLFGRGNIEFIKPENPKVLAFLRQHDNETLLVVANLSRYSQFVELDLSEFRGQIPVELFGQTRFPPIGELPYLLTLGPYAFYWFLLKWSGNEAEPLTDELPECCIYGSWDTLFDGKAPRSQLEGALPAFLNRHRWFAGKGRVIQHVNIVDVLTVVDHSDNPGEREAAPGQLDVDLHSKRIIVVRIEYVEGEAQWYLLPVVFARGEQRSDILGDRPGAGIITVERIEDIEGATLCDSTYEDDFWKSLFDAIARDATIVGRNGRICSMKTEWYARLPHSDPGMIHPHMESESVASSHESSPYEVAICGEDQRHTSALLGSSMIMKMFRRIEKGENPELEIGRYLTDEKRLDCAPRLAGALEYTCKDGSHFTLATLHEYIPNEGNAWNYIQDEISRFIEWIESEASHPAPTEAIQRGRSLVDLLDQTPPESAREYLGSYLDYAEMIGKRTAEMHSIIANGNSESFTPESFSKLYRRSLYQSMRAGVIKTFELLAKRITVLPKRVADRAKMLLRKKEKIINRYRDLLTRNVFAKRMRCHGDFHLGQLIFTGKDFVIIDFEGDPSRTIGERRIKTSPLRDVASMIRSFHYASNVVFAGWQKLSMPSSKHDRDISDWLKTWYTWSAVSYLKAYLNESAADDLLPNSHEDMKLLLDVYLLEKAISELDYELNNRLEYVHIPIEGSLELLETYHGPNKRTDQPLNND